MADDSYERTTLEASGANSVALSPDETRIFVARSDGNVDVFDVASRALIASWDIGTSLGGLSISEDGSFLLAVELSIAPAPPAQSSVLYRVDTATGAVTTYTKPGSAFLDVEIVDSDTAIVTSGQSQLQRLDLTTGIFSDVANGLYNSTVVEDEHLTLLAQSGVSNGPLAIYDDRTDTIVAQGDNYQSGASSGYNWGHVAISESAGMVVQFSYFAGLNIFDLNLQFQRWMSIPGPVDGVAFDPTGTYLYVRLLNGSLEQYVAATGTLVESFPLGASSWHNNPGAADQIAFSDDGKIILVHDNNTGKLEIIDLRSRDQQIDGTAGGEALDGGRGDDTYIVNHAGDTVTELQYQGVDTVRASVDFILSAHVERLELTGTAITGTGNDLRNDVIGNAEANTLNGGGENDWIVGNGGDDVLYGGTGDDTLLGQDGNDTLGGEDGNDTLDGGTGTDTHSGGTGDDTYYVDDASDVVNEAPGEGNDRVIASASWSMGSGQEIETLVTSDAAGTLAIDLAGNAFANRIEGNAGNNALYGNDGDDVLLGGAGDDLIDGGSGTDTASYADATNGVTIDASLETAQNTGWGTDRLVGVEKVVGSEFDDTITTPLWSVELFGAGGNDVLRGSAGYDILHGGAGNDQLFTGGQPNFSFYVYDRIYGDDGDDTIVIDNPAPYGSAIYDGGAGFDTLDLGPPSEDFPLLLMEFWTLSGIERIRFGGEAGTTTYAVASLSQVATSGLTHVVGSEGYDHLILNTGPIGGTFTIPELTLTSWNSAYNAAGDVVSLTSAGSAGFVLNAREGLASAQYLAGSDGNDTLNGSSGNEYLDGGAGENVLNGNGGDDILTIINRSVFPTGLSTLTGAGSTFNGGDGFDMLAIGGAVDFAGAVSGIEGILLHPGYETNDPFIYSPEAALTVTAALLNTLPADLKLEGWGTVVVNLAPGDTVDASRFVHSGSTVQMVFNGSTANDTMRGSSGNDTLDGGIGADAMTGGSGNDTYVVDDAGDTVSEAAGEGSDTVEASASHTLGANVENLTLTGSEAIAGTGNGLSNTLTGNSGSNTLDGGDGYDTLNGLEGHDWLQGGDGGDSLSSNEGHDSVWGGSGGDWLAGGAGDDTLYGGEGIDTATYASAAARVEVDLSWLEEQNTRGAGTDTLISIENLVGSAFDDALTGDAQANGLAGGGGADVLAGGEGNDRFVYQALADSTAAAADHITDFTAGDLIDLSALDASSGAGGDQAFGFIGSAAFSNTAGELRAEFDSGAGAWRIEGDVDGNGAADFLILATAAAPLTGSDFVL